MRVSIWQIRIPAKDRTRKYSNIRIVLSLLSIRIHVLQTAGTCTQVGRDHRSSVMPSFTRTQYTVPLGDIVTMISYGASTNHSMHNYLIFSSKVWLCLNQISPLLSHRLSKLCLRSSYTQSWWDCDWVKLKNTFLIQKHAQSKQRADMRTYIYIYVLHKKKFLLLQCMHTNTTVWYPNRVTR